MIDSKFTILGIQVAKKTHDANEWAQAFGPDSMRQEATLNVWYRSTAAEARNIFLHGREEEKDGDKVTVKAVKGLDDLTGINRLTKRVKNAKGDKEVEVWDESEATYFKRVIATLVKTGKHPTVEAATAWAASLLQAAVDLVPFDASKAPPAEKKAKATPQEFTIAAQGFIDSGKAAKIAAYLSKTVGRTVTEELADLAKGLHEDAKRMAEEAKAAQAKKLAAMLA